MATTNSAGATKNKMEITTPTDLEIVMTRAFDAPRRLVWEAHTSAEHLPNWMLGPEGWTMPICEIDLRPGGTWRCVWRREDGSEMEIRGVYQEVVPHERLVNTELWGGDWPETLNTLLLDEENGKTLMTSKMLYPTKETRDKALQSGMAEGVDLGYDRLDEYLGEMG